MNARILALSLAALASAAAPSPAAAQTDTTRTDTTRTDTAAVSVSVGKTAEPTPAATIHPAAVPRARRSLNTITYEEVRNSRAMDAYTLVQNLRPSWLRTPRGQMSLAMQIDVAVFMNGIRMGTRETLHNIPITSVRTMRFYTATEARQKFGGDTSAGAIEILSQ